MPSARSNAHLFWPALVAVVVLDVATKAAVVQFLDRPHVPHEVLGNAVRLTLAYNRGAAFGVDVGAWSRIILSLVAIVVTIVLFRLYRETPAGETMRPLALGLLCGGAIGNLIDRIRSSRGVIDFIDVGVGNLRFWTFNVADSAVTVGAVMLAWVMLREERRQKSEGERRR
jgi:signal peptidase II